MQVKISLPVLAFCLVALPAVGRAALTQQNFQLRTTADLVDLCSATQSDPMYTAGINFCHGFAVGVFRTLTEADAARHPSRRTFCMTEPAPSRDEGIASFVQWAKTNQGQLDQPPADAIAVFLSQRYPCPQSTASKKAVR